MITNSYNMEATKKYCKIIKRRFIQVLENIENLLTRIPENLYNKKISGYLIWKQIYHMLNSLERNFIDPNNYTYPEFHEEKLNSLDYKSKRELDKKILEKYFKNIKKKVLNHLNYLDDNKILDIINFKNIKITKLDFILSQYIHIMWHIGYLYSCINIETGKYPEYIGLYKNY